MCKIIRAPPGFPACRPVRPVPLTASRDRRRRRQTERSPRNVAGTVPCVCVCVRSLRRIHRRRAHTHRQGIKLFLLSKYNVAAAYNRNTISYTGRSPVKITGFPDHRRRIRKTVSYAAGIRQSFDLFGPAGPRPAIIPAESQTACCLFEIVPLEVFQSFFSAFDAPDCKNTVFRARPNSHRVDFREIRE